MHFHVRERTRTANEITRDFLVKRRVHQFSNLCAVSVAVYAITAINNCASVVWKPLLA